MIQGIIDGILTALKSEYPDYKRYTDKVEQGMKTPCFFVLCTNPSKEDQLGTRQSRSYQFMVQYIPKSKDDPRTECLEVCDVLIDILSDITADGKLIRGTRMNGQVVDGVLQFSVTYSMFAMAVQNQEQSMDELGEVKVNGNS